VQDFYRCEEGMLPRVLEVDNIACYKLVADMHYKTRIQAIVTYCSHIEGRKVKKEFARYMRLMREQFLQVNIEHY